MGVETAGAPPGGFFQRKKCSTQRILCQVDDRNHLGGLENTFIWDGQSQLTGFKMFDYLRLGQSRLLTPVMVLVDGEAV